MEWQQLEYFQTLAHIQHVTRAAESLCITQPALSRSMARLEEELGVPLFDRKGRTINIKPLRTTLFEAGRSHADGI